MPQRVIRLRSDNFTPPARTPWGGTRLLGRFKRELGIAGVSASAKVGESWELSVSDEFHSLTDTGERLATVLGRDPESMLGVEAQGGNRLTALLVKWLDAGDDLSLQIHPEDNYPGLGPGEAGKLEAWYVVDCDRGAGLYLGFGPQVSRQDVVNALREGSDLSALMAFEAVQPGDFVLVEPGTPHAVGKGVTLVEPQWVAPERRAVTYRYWDWNRRYAGDGRPLSAGEPRALHVDHALAVTRWERASDAAWLASRRAGLGWPDAAASVRLDLLCGPEPGCVVPSSRLRVARLCGTGPCRLPAWNALRSFTVIEGEVLLGRGERAVRVRGGSTVAVTAYAGALEAELSHAHALLAATAG